ncbi:hypothetical protein ACFOLF_02705 [Paenibacillus sepulcri]|uniref:Uncharacterized protein n=1 Tax=Paenibacillus sepulcri TaxID=359917 RepID=A0ABS7CDB8_9BACL|nr:hypothetical protein [Paenibacillus sepulcri]
MFFPPVYSIKHLQPNETAFDPKLQKNFNSGAASGNKAALDPELHGDDQRLVLIFNLDQLGFALDPGCEASDLAAEL